MKEQSKLRHSEEQGSEAAHQSQQKSEAKEFSSVEEMLRFDAGQNVPSPSVAQRLNESLAKEPKLSTSWWERAKRVFSKRS